jgi:glycosyltransferase involved in cell wall biosynthesis
MSSSQSRKYVLVQTVAPHYRQAFFDAMADELGDSLTILSGGEYFDPNLKTEVVNRRLSATAHNIFLFRRRMVFQWGVVLRAMRADVAILEYNPRIINTWIVAAFRKVLRRRTILWGHVYSRRGSDNFSRAFQRKFSDAMVVYTEDQRDILREVLKYNGGAYAAPNAIFNSKEMQPVPSADRHSFLYVGRLVKEKKPSIMISAFASAVSRLPEKAMLLVVGDGTERPGMEKLSAELGIADRVQMLGPISDYEKLRTLYGRSIATLSPGYVGLSITQSLGFGVPMIYSKDEPHSVEIISAREGWNSLTFQTDSSDDFCNTMLKITRERESWIDRAEEISTDCRQRFSIETMAREFVKAIREVDES